MELLPVLSDFFGMTVDKLLGINEAVEQKKVEEYLNRFQEAINQGKVYDCMCDKWLLFKDFDKLRNTDEFKEVINFLN